MRGNANASGAVSLHFERTSVLSVPGALEEFALITAQNASEEWKRFPETEVIVTDSQCDLLGWFDTYDAEPALQFREDAASYRIQLAPHGFIAPKSSRSTVAHVSRPGQVTRYSEGLRFDDPLLPRLRTRAAAHVVFPATDHLRFIESETAAMVTTRVATWDCAPTSSRSIPIVAQSRLGPSDVITKILDDLHAALHVAALSGVAHRVGSEHFVRVVDALRPQLTKSVLGPMLHRRVAAALRACRKLSSLRPDHQFETMRAIVDRCRKLRDQVHEVGNADDEIFRPVPGLSRLVRRAVTIPTGHEHFNAYERAMEKLLTALFHPSLVDPITQMEINQGRKRIDITYRNVGSDGCFGWFAKRYEAPHVLVECKNYGREIGNPELDQIIGRFSPTVGRFGLLVCRQFEDKELFIQRCRDAALAGHGTVLPLDDSDLDELVRQRNSGTPNRLLLDRFRRLI
jgi:hypothetical protein